MGTGMSPAAKQWWIDLTARTKASTMAGFLAVAPGVDVRPELGQIKCPCLVFTTDSKRHPLTEVQSWQVKIPRSELVVVPGDAYHAAASAPDFCAEHTLAFMRRHAA